jgi:inorganic pyrophosphatase
VFVSLATSFVATHLVKVRSAGDVEASLKRQLVVSTILQTGVTLALSFAFFPKEFDITPVTGVNDVLNVKNWHIFICVMCGLWSGLLIGFTTEYYTSHSYAPVREVSNACKTGAATNIIYGMALGYLSVIIPVFALAVTIYVSHSLAGMYGIATAALGILSTLATGLTIDAYGPICDNAGLYSNAHVTAVFLLLPRCLCSLLRCCLLVILSLRSGGIAEMTGMPHEVRDITDALDAAGNTTAAIGKGFAIGSAALVSLALFGAFVTTTGLTSVDILQPFQFAGLLVGAMLPYWFSAMTMKSVGIAALAMVAEVRRQFALVPTVNGEKDFSRFRADYSHCVRISTDASLRMMIAPGALVMLTPLIVGFFFGVNALAGVLAGALVSGVQMAISSSNTGGAWDNAKKYIESGALGEGFKKGSDTHKAAVVGDTVGDPLKDTSGPSLNILIKLMAIISLVFAPAFSRIKDGIVGKF